MKRYPFLISLILLTALVLFPAGALAGWEYSGIPVCSAPNYQMYHSITDVGGGFTVMTWQDFRSGVSYDIYAQKVDLSGTTLWTSNGVVICGASGDQINVEITSNGPGGAIASWEDKRSGADVYAQRINANGSPGWPWPASSTKPWPASTCHTRPSARNKNRRC